MTALTARHALTDRGFWIHFLQMVAAMVLGMLVLGMLWPSFGSVEADTLVMATNMTIGMTAWMGYRRHGWAAIAEMAAAMYLSFVVLFPAFWLGWLTGEGVMVVGHVLMLPAMVLAMLWRPAEYVGHRERRIEDGK